MTDVSKLKASSGRAGRKHGGTVCIFIFLVVLAVFMALPIYLAVVMSVKPSQEWFMFPPKFYAMDPTLDNFREMFRAAGQLWVPFSRYVANSVFVTAAVTLAQCFTASMAAFVLAKGKFRGSKFLNSVIVISLLYQSNVIYIVQYMVIAKLGMIDTYAALILPSVATPMGVFHMYGKNRSEPMNYFDSGSCRCFYYSPFYQSYYFHSILYYQDPTPQRVMDATLGADVSHGCVRLALDNAKWIYKYVPNNTTVVSYNRKF